IESNILSGGNPCGHACGVAFAFQKSGMCPVQVTPRPAVLAFAETKPDGVVHRPACWASTGRLTRVINTGPAANPPRSKRRRPATGSALGGDGSGLELVLVGSVIPMVPVEAQE